MALVLIHRHGREFVVGSICRKLPRVKVSHESVSDVDWNLFDQSGRFPTPLGRSPELEALETVVSWRHRSFS